MACTLEYVAALEQLAVSEAVAHAQQADAAGFDGVVVFDRFAPWLPSHGNAPFAWSVLGALGAQTGGMLTLSAVPGGRMHPASIAQASATIAAMHPERHTLLLSAGDAIDEHVTGDYWPEASVRVARSFEAAEIVKKLFGTVRRGSDARHEGEAFRLESARLWTGPAATPPVLIWAGGPVTARRAGRSADGIVVAARDSERMATIVRAARAGAQEAGRDPEALILAAYAQLAWAPDQAGVESAVLRDWPMAGLRFPRGDIRSPFDVEQLARMASIDEIRARLPVSADPEVHIAELRRLAGLGFTRLYVHNVLREQREWIAMFGERIAPALREGLA